MLAEVNLDLDAIRAKMEKLGLAERGARGPARAVTIVVEGLDELRAARAACARRSRATAACARCCRSSSRAGRAVLAVDADEDAAGLVARLTRRAPEGLHVTMVEQGPGRATVRVDWQPPAPAPTAATDGGQAGPD